MAKLLLSCDDYIFSHDGNFYFKNHEWENFYQRYLRVFDAIKIANRVQEEKELNQSRVLINDPRIEVVNIPIFHGPKDYFCNYLKIGKCIRGVVDDCDAAILRIPSTIAQRVSSKVLKSRIPYAVEVVYDANDGVNAYDSIISKILWRIIDWRMKFLCKRADGVSCVTEHHLQKRYFSNKTGSFVSNYSSLSLDKSFYTAPRFDPKGKQFKIAHVTTQIHLHGRKGQAELVKAVELLKNRGVSVDVNFVGEDKGGSIDELMAFASLHNVADQIHCLGYLNRTQLSDILDNSDIFVLPTKAEGLPRVIIEAMAKGLPCITTPVSGNPELISTEYLVEYDDVENLSDKIYQLISSSDCYQKESKSNFEKALLYESTILEQRRDLFYSKLKKIVSKEI